MELIIRVLWKTPAVTALACVVTFANAQQSSNPINGHYPDRPVRLLVGNEPGGGVDLTARAVALKLTEEWRSPIVVDNRGGAKGIIAMDLTEKATPDGYTLMAASASSLVSATVLKKVKYDIRKAYAPITQLGSAHALVLMATPSLPVRSLKDVIAYSKAKPGTLNLGTSGLGSLAHGALELIKSAVGVDIVHVPYKGAGPALADLVGGQVQLAFGSTISAIPYIKTGRVRPLAVTGSKRLRAYPDIPTVAEAGVPGFEMTNWYALFAPAATPTAVVQLLNLGVIRALNNPDVQNKLGGAEEEAFQSSSPAEVKGRLAQEMVKWEKLAKIPSFADHAQ